ncbi:hypothetical protein D3C71_1682610 [compost metagenome]
MSQEQLDRNYSYTEEVCNEVFTLFSEVSSCTFNEALSKVSVKLGTDEEIRAYLALVISVIYAWADDVDLCHWFSIMCSAKTMRKEWLREGIVAV